MLKITYTFMIVGGISLLTIFKLFFQSKEQLSYVWLEVKLLQTWINTAFICVFSLFTYPFAILLLAIQFVFVYVRPLHNPDQLSKLKWIRESLLSIIWLCGTCTILALLIFGVQIDQARS